MFRINVKNEAQVHSRSLLQTKLEM